MKTNFHLRVASHTRINLFAVVEEFVYVGSVCATKLSMEKCMGNTVKRMTFLVHITMEICVLVSIIYIVSLIATIVAIC
jgi:hypothetical protein